MRSSWKRKGMNILLGNAKSDPEEGAGNSDGNRPTHLKDPFVLHDCPKVEGVELLMEQLHLLKGLRAFPQECMKPSGLHIGLQFKASLSTQLQSANAPTMTKSPLSLQMCKKVCANGRPPTFSAPSAQYPYRRLFFLLLFCYPMLSNQHLAQLWMYLLCIR